MKKTVVEYLTNTFECFFLDQEGPFGSNMDFGFNGHGICFNETTHRYSHTEVKEGM